MRIIKLSTKEFATFEDVLFFFEEDLPQRTPPGQFRLPPGWIAEDGLERGETLLFTYLAALCYSAKAGSGRLENTDKYRIDYPYYFKVNMKSVRRVKLSIEALEKRLRPTGRRKSIVKSHGWPTMPDTPAREQLWQSLR